MKTITSILFIMLLIVNATGQTIDKLDDRNGYKDFTLGDSFLKWQDQLKFEADWENDSKAYLYTGVCCQKVFDYNVDKIILRFSKEKLVGIYITTEKFRKVDAESGQNIKWRNDDFESIKSSFSELYGEPSTYDASEGSNDLTYIWLGKRVVLFSKYEFLGVQKGDRQQIIVADLYFLNKGIENKY
jgi:hypothetical protein